MLVYFKTHTIPFLSEHALHSLAEPTYNSDRNATLSVDEKVKREQYTFECLIVVALYIIIVVLKNFICCF